MSEYMEKHTVSRLVGSPGYVGYEEGGQLTEAVRRKPFSVALRRDREGPSRRVQHVAADPRGGSPSPTARAAVDFRNIVLIMTSNLGTADLRKANIGFTTADPR